MKTKDAQIRARAPQQLKQDAEAILAELGLTPTQAITMLYRQIVLTRGLPFEVRLPNAKTRAVMADIAAGRNVETYGSVAELEAQVAGETADPEPE